MRTSGVLEATPARDRERPKQPFVPTRQSLQVVGRVASRVRTSGISTLSKANTFLNRQRNVDNEAVNSSPWGVGFAAPAKKLPSSAIDSKQPTDEKDVSAAVIQDTADIAEFASPISALTGSPSSTAKLQKSNGSLTTSSCSQKPLEESVPVKGVSKKDTQTRVERRSGARNTPGYYAGGGAAWNLVRSVSKSASRSTHAETKEKEVEVNSLRKIRTTVITKTDDHIVTRAQSTLAIGESFAKAQRMLTIAAAPAESEKLNYYESELSNLRVHHTASILMPDADLESQSPTEVKTGRRFGILNLMRTGSKQDSKDKGNKGNGEMVRRSSRLTENALWSKIGSGPLFRIGRKEKDLKERQERNSKEKKRNQDKKAKDGEGRGKKIRSGWFIGGSEQNDGGSKKMKKVKMSRMGSKTRRQQGESNEKRRGGPATAAGPATPAESATPAGSATPALSAGAGSARSPKTLDYVKDFVDDEYFDSDEDNELESATVPRSILIDDFITYQTGKGKKQTNSKGKHRSRAA